MIPISVSDIIKILDQIPIWRNLAAFPKRLDSLEARLAALESAKPSLLTAPVIDPAKACPMCGAEMKVVAENPHPQFDFAGVKVHQMTCPSCSHHTSRDFRPGKGYK
jgi:hypothetical protein